MVFALGARTGVSTVAIPMRAAFRDEVRPVAPVAVSNQETRLLTVGRRLDRLPPDPDHVRAGRSPPGRSRWPAWRGAATAASAPSRCGLTRGDEEGGEWLDASLSDALSRSSWRQWVVAWTARPGDYRIEVRATDGDGETQTEVRRRTDPDGATGYHGIKVKVREA